MTLYHHRPLNVRPLRHPLTAAPAEQQLDCISTDELGDVPVVAALNRWGQFTELAGLIEPEFCDHSMSGWSSSLALRCPRCGGPMFLPRIALAFVPGSDLEEMHRLWQLAGCPPWDCGDWASQEDYWTLRFPALFDPHGLPVRNDRLAAFDADLYGKRDA